MEKSGQKRTSVHKGDVVGAKAVLLELEGTVIPIGFVKERLYGYVKDNAKSFLTAHFDDAAIQKILDALRSQAASDVEKKVEGSVAIPEKTSPKADMINAVVENVEWHLSKGLMTEAVEKIIVHILEEAYKKEDDIHTKLFDDVVPALKQWANKGVKAYVLSSRSIEFQKLLFANTKDGDVSEKISRFIDLADRPKSVKETYVKVADDLELTPGDIIFLTGSVNEATAASAAGMQTYLVVRDGSAKSDDISKEICPCPTVHLLTELSEGTEADGIPQKKACHTSPKSGSAEVHK